MSVEYVGVGSPVMYSPCTRRRSSRTHKPTEKMAEYTRALQKDDSSTSEDESAVEVEKRKEEGHGNGCIMMKDAEREKAVKSKEGEEKNKDELVEEKDEQVEHSRKFSIDGKPEINTTHDQTLEAIETAEGLLEDINNIFGDSANDISHLGDSTCVNSKKSNENKLEKELSIHHEKTKQLHIVHV